jgi:lipoate-protein ligase A
VVTPLLAHRAEFAAAAEASAARDWPVVVRRTGGGPVPQGPETLNISLAFASAREQAPTIDTTFRDFAGRLIAALAACNVTAEIGEIEGSCCPGRYDIAIAGRKIIGIAQRRRQGKHGESLLTAILVHAIFWLEGNLTEGIDALERFLAEAGVSQRFTREHMATLQELTNVTAQHFETALLRLTPAASAP